MELGNQHMFSLLGGWLLSNARRLLSKGIPPQTTDFGDVGTLLDNYQLHCFTVIDCRRPENVKQKQGVSHSP